MTLSLCVTRLSAERDQAERDNREKETKILNQTRELDELHERMEQLERARQAQARELEDLMSSKDDVGKNVQFFLANTTLNLTSYQICGF